MQKTLKVKVIVEGNADGDLLVCRDPVSPLGDIDPVRGVLKTKEGEQNLKGKVLVFPFMRGSTVGSYVVYALKHYRKEPAAIIVSRAEPILITGCVLAGIPLAETVGSNVVEEAMGFRKARLVSVKKILVLES